MGRRIRTSLGTMMAVAGLAAGATSLVSASAGSATSIRPPVGLTASGLDFPSGVAAAGSPAMGSHVRPLAPGENPPGRVTQTSGLAGYEVPTGSTTTVSTDVTVPTYTCNHGSNPNFGDVVTSGPEPYVAVGFNSTFQVATNLLFNCQANDFAGVSTVDPNCSSSFGRGSCPYEGFIGGSVSAGDTVQLTASLSASAATSTLTDLTSGGHLSFTIGGISVTSSSSIIGAEDFCFLPSESSAGCGFVDGSSPVPPPGYDGFTPFSFTSATINGTGLGAYLAGPNSAGWIQINDVWGATLEGQTTYVNGGDSFTDTNAQLQLPTVSLSQPRVDQPTSGTATLNFVATLSFSTGNPVYLDYATADGTANAGTNYTGTSGVLAFPAGTTTQTIPVTVLAGPQTPAAGNVLSMSLNLTNPSYVAAGTSNSGLINEGPIVTSVAPMVVPLNGGPAMTVTVTGYDLQNVVAVKFCPTSNAGGGACLSGGSVSVQSDSTLTVAAPDATNALPAGSPTLPADTIATDGNGVSSPVMAPGDTETFGCTVRAITDGDYQASGCLTDEPNGDDITQQPSHVDGVEVSASPTDDVTYVPGTAKVSSSGSVKVTLPLTSSDAVTIFQGPLSKALSGPVTFTVPSGTMVAGIGISGSLSLTPNGLGQATGSVTATLPTILGGGKGTLSFTTATGGTLSNVQITVPKANFMKLFSLSNLTLAFNAPGTWTIAADASTGGTTSTAFSGNLVFANNMLKSGALTVSSISLAGMVTISDLKVTYNGGSWSGSAKVKQAAQSASVAIGITGNTITSASLKTGAVPLFGLINVQSFDLEYNGTRWSLAVTSTLSGGGTASANLAVSGGVISSAQLTLTKFALASTVTIASATVSYSATAPNPACTAVTTGTEIWCGSWDVQLPQATTLNGVSGSLVFVNGTFQSGSVDVTGSVPLLDGVFLTQLGATLKLTPTVVGGSATLSFGPQISNTSALSVKGTLTRTFPSGTTAGSYAANGTVTALAGSSHSLPLGSVAVTVPDTGTTSVKLTLGGGPSGLSVSAGGATATITGDITGTFTGSTFSLAGTTSITVPVFGTVSGNLKADNQGVAACGKVSSGTQVGFEYLFATGGLKVLDTKGCTEKGF